MNQTLPELSRPPLQRVAAVGEIAVAQRFGATRLVRLFQEGSGKIRLPRRREDPLEAILINTAGGLTGGDRVAWRVDAAEDSSISVTTQACEKIYRSSHGGAETRCMLVAGERSRIAWLPQETIVYDRSSFRRRLDVDLAHGAEALIVEATVFGRRAMGEHVGLAEFADRWRVRYAGRLIHAEEFRMGPDIGTMLANPTTTGGATAVATVLVVSDDAEIWLDKARAIIGDTGGASVWRVGGTGKLLARLVAPDGYALRSRLIPLVQLLNGQAGLPKTWSF